MYTNYDAVVCTVSLGCVPTNGGLFDYLSDPTLPHAIRLVSGPYAQQGPVAMLMCARYFVMDSQLMNACYGVLH